jgi:MFS family permease
MSAVTETVEAPVEAAPSKADERRAIAVASGAHALHDGYTDLIYVMLPIWQQEFAISYAALGLLRTCYSGTMASLQIPSALLSERLGIPLVLAMGTALSGVGYLIAGGSIGFWTLVLALLVGGLGSSTQHPLASALVARAFAGSRAMKALGTYNFAGDIGKMAVPAAVSLLLVLLPWQPVLAIMGMAGLVVAVVVFWLAPRLPAEQHDKVAEKKEAAVSGARGRSYGFPLLLAIGMVDSATRMGFLIFLPFILIAKVRACRRSVLR